MNMLILLPFYYQYDCHHSTDKVFDSALFTRIVFVDLQKAFAKTDHKTVIHKMHY